MEVINPTMIESITYVINSVIVLSIKREHHNEEVSIHPSTIYVTYTLTDLAIKVFLQVLPPRLDRYIEPRNKDHINY